MFDELTMPWVVFVAGNFLLFWGFFLLFFPEKEENFRNGFLISALILLALAIGLRAWNVGIDTPKYVAAFASRKVLVYHQLEIYEPLYIVLGLFLRSLLVDYHLFLFLWSFFLAFFLFLAYRSLLPPRLAPLALGLYTGSFVFWLSNLSMLRQGLTISLLFYAYALYERGKGRAALFTASLAPLLHFSALLFPFFYFLWRFLLYLTRRGGSWFFLLLAGTILGLLYPGSLFHGLLKAVFDLLYRLFAHPYVEKIQWYLTWSKLTPWHLKHVYYLLLALLLVGALGARRHERLAAPFSLLWAGFLVIFLCKYDEMVADRMFMYFVPGVPVLILSLVKCFFPERDQRLLYAALLCAGLVWFNVKFFLLQYQGWFISPFPAVR